MFNFLKRNVLTSTFEISDSENSTNKRNCSSIALLSGPSLFKNNSEFLLNIEETINGYILKIPQTKEVDLKRICINNGINFKKVIS